MFSSSGCREGQGKSGGYRIIVFYQIGERVFFVHGFPKSEQENISQTQQDKFRDMAAIFLELPDNKLAELVATKEFTEVKSHEKE